MTKPTRVRVLLLSPAKRILLIKYRNTGPTGIPQPCWTTAGGGRKSGETIEQTALREIAEETCMTDIRLGPVVWYGEDRHRSGAWKTLFQEHFIVAFAAHEKIDQARWTEHEREQIIETRWWTLDDLRTSSEAIYPFNLADRLEPILRGEYPSEIIKLPRI
ncbi:MULTISPECIES: NUDIX hydrolase [Acidiphilium]|uniref:ADP-ribose pyrophosphatase YjhB, NUDIX family n=1 Tax=Acidiphilium rubrum TaxID=526 RepID=A0A8G2FL79_ACIRU|nr:MULTISPECIES: NUDIX domain-containing protein [Acidiphilium]SIQ29973.1 ADP-ribose pyrophosphatase YjhB, NUDIX family [Acidiphilium rubrum]